MNNNNINDDDEDKRVKIEVTDTDASNVHYKEGNLDCSAGGACCNSLVEEFSVTI